MMGLLRQTWLRLVSYLRRRELEREFDEELEAHVDLAIQDYLRQGLSHGEARRQALVKLGGREQAREVHREARGMTWLEGVVQDLRYAARGFRRSPGFTFTAVAVLALAIGANTAMFSVLNAVLLRPLPYPAPDQLMMLWSEDPSQGVREGRSSYIDVERWRSESGSFVDFAVFDPASVTLTREDGAEKISVARISPNFFTLLGVLPLDGRGFSAEEANQRQRVVLISHRFWQARFAGSDDAVGAQLELDGLPSRIIGILPEDFQFDDAEVWEPHTLSPDWGTGPDAGSARSWMVIARLREGATPEQAQAEMSAIASRLKQQLPAAERNRGVSVVPLDVQVTGPTARRALWMLSGAVFLVLLIAATNVAGLSLARSPVRAREIAVRAALGASRPRIVRQLLVESLSLAAVSGLFGLLAAFAAIRLILAVTPVNLARLNEANLDPRVLGLAVGLCAVAGILAGLAPAITLSRGSLRPSGLETRGIAGGVAARRIRRALVVTEFALAIMLLAGAGLLVRSLWSVEDVALGFRPEGVLSVQLATSASTPYGQRTTFYAAVLEGVERLPGVESSGIIGDLVTGSAPEQIVTIEGATSTTERLRFRRDEISPGFFSAVGASLLEGRFFSDADGPDAPRVAIINESMARRLWPGRDPVGRRFKLGPADSGAPWFTVAGIVDDMRRQGLENEPVPQMFEPLAQNPSRLATLLVRTSSDDPLTMVSAVRAAVSQVDKQAPVYGVAALEDQLDGFLAARRFQTSLLIAFSLAALLIAAIGIYGLLQYSIATRTREIGIRMAVGAQRGGIFRMIAGEGLKLSLAGLVLGLAGAWWLGQAGSSLLFGVTATDPPTFLAVSGLLIAVATAACWFPARRAMKVKPVEALRHG